MVQRRVVHWRLCVDLELWLWSLRRRLGSASNGRMSGQSPGWIPYRLAMLGRAQNQVNAAAGPAYPSRISAPGTPSTKPSSAALPNPSSGAFSANNCSVSAALVGGNTGRASKVDRYPAVSATTSAASLRKRSGESMRGFIRSEFYHAGPGQKSDQRQVMVSIALFRSQSKRVTFR
jgi:hypothetical protein